MSRKGIAWTEDMTSQLVAMRDAGTKNNQIARALEVSPGVLQSRITELIHSGRLTSRRGLLWSQPDCYVAGREQKVDTVSDQVAQLYREGKPHKEIGTRVRLTENQVHHILSILFASGLPKRERGLTDDQAREIHRSYMLGGSIEMLAREIGFTGPTVRKRLRELRLPVGMKLVGAKRRSVVGERGAHTPAAEYTNRD
jgi:hypothetical protein